MVGLCASAASVMIDTDQHFKLSQLPREREMVFITFISQTHKTIYKLVRNV